MNETVAAVNQPKTQFKDYPDVLTVQQTAELLSVCKNTIYSARMICLVGGSDRPSGSGRTMCWTICVSKKLLIKQMNYVLEQPAEARYNDLATAGYFCTCHRKEK